MEINRSNTNTTTNSLSRTKKSNKYKKHLENGTKETCKEGERKKSEMRIFYCQFFQTALF